METNQTAQEPAIAIENLVKTFTGKKRSKVEALKGISFTVEPGEVFGFLGPNGAGKSTTIKCLVGLIKPSSGSTRIKGVPASEVESRRHIGYLPENPAFFDYLSALVKEIMLDLKKRGKSVFFSTHITADVESVCDRVGIILNGELQSVERVENIMAQGITGYTLTLRQGGVESERYVPKEELSSAMHEIQSSGTEISLIEPRRKSLEDFFLDIVRAKGR
jgi:ABC-type multidrug transport system ATPase subunit